MLTVYILLIFYFIPIILTDKCPLINNCTCSQDLTIINCVNQQLTHVNIEFPKSTVILNLSINSLTSINSLSKLNNLQTLDLSHNKIENLPLNLFSKFPQLSSLYLTNNSLKTIPKTFNEISNINLDISNNPLNCTCQLKWLNEWFKTINHIKRINCQKSKYLNENDFCLNNKNFVNIIPDQSQIVYQDDPFLLNCSSNTNTFWTFNNQFFTSNSTIFIPHLQYNHTGIWTCHSLNLNRSISLYVLNIQTNHFCSSIQMDTPKGHFYWPRTLIGQTVKLKCPFGAAPWFTSHAKGYYSCSLNRQWIDLDLSQCAFRTNLSREFDRLLTKNQTNILSKLVTHVSKINLNEFQFDDIIFLIDIIDDEFNKYMSMKKHIEEMSMLIYRLADFILQINHELFFIQEYQLALHRLRTILERLIDLTNYSWVYVGKQLTTMTLESPLPPTVCFIPNRPLLTIICGIDNQHYKRHELRLATIQFPLRSNISFNQSSIYRIIFYRQSTLFTLDKLYDNNPVVYIKPIISTNDSFVKITFYGHSNQASIGIWNSNELSWQIKSTNCKIIRQNIDLISTECLLTKNLSLSMTYQNNFKYNKSLLLNANYLDLAIYVSTIIASICFFLCLLFYVCCHRAYLMPRSFFHCLVNYWMSLGILLPLFAFGIKQTQHLFLCQFIAVSLHYLCLTTILWLTLLTYCVWQKLYSIWSGKGHGDDENLDQKHSATIVDYDDDGLPIMKIKAKPVIQFYFLAYGIAFIICGINVAISRDQYITNNICFLNNFESLLTLFIPISVFVFLLFIFLLAAHINIKRLTKEAIRLRNLPDECENEENDLSTKPNEALPIVVPSNNENHQETVAHVDCRQSHLDSLCSSDMDHQHQPSNQLLSILFQLFLLIFIFASCLSIYIQPLRSYSIRYEYSIYNHVYGFFVLLLAFYSLAFYVLSRSDLTMHCQYYCNCCSNRKKKRLLNQSYTEPPPPPQTPQLSPANPADSLTKDNETDRLLTNQNINADESFTEQIPAPSTPNSHYSSNTFQIPVVQNNEITTMNNGNKYGSKHQAIIASKYYARHRHILKTSVSNSEASLQQNDSLPLSTLVPIQQESSTFIDDQHELSYPIMSTKTNDSPIESHIIHNGNARLHKPSVISPRSVVRPSLLPVSPRVQASPSQAIIRPLPIVRLSTPTANKSPISLSSALLTNGHENSLNESNAGQNSYRVMPSPSTEQRQATFVYLNKNINLVQQVASAKEAPDVWKKSVNGHHPHVAYIDEDEDGSVSLKSSTNDSTTEESSSTTSPVLSKKERSQTISSSSSSSISNFSDKFCNGNLDTNQIILHESSV